MKRCVQRFAVACFETRARAPLVYALLLVVCAGPAMAQGVRYNDVARTKDNRPLSNGTVAVCVANPTDPGNVGSRHTTPPGPVCVTWGALKQITWAAWQRYCDEAHAIISPAWMDKNGCAACGVAYSALRADSKAIADPRRSHADAIDK